MSSSLASGTCAMCSFFICTITKARGHIYLRTSIRRCRGLFRLSGAFSRRPFSADYTIIMFEFDFRQEQPLSGATDRKETVGSRYRPTGL